MRPYIICHMTCSIDQKVTGDFLSTKLGQLGADIYYQINRELKCDAFACGRVTMESSFTSNKRIDLTDYQEGILEDYIVLHDYYAISFDRYGKVGWTKNKIEDDDEGYDQAYIIEVLSDQVDLRYLTYLKSLNISYIIVKHDDYIKEALYKLKTLFYINKILLEGGSIINSAFEKENVIDELSLVIVPMTTNNGLPLFESHHNNNYQLNNLKTYDDIIWMNYKRRENI